MSKQLRGFNPESRLYTWAFSCQIRNMPVTLTVGSSFLSKAYLLMENWLRTDETQEAVLALQLASEQLANLVSTGNPHYWSWVIVGLHNALQGFMVLSLRSGNNINVLAKDCAEEWLAAYECGDENFPEQKLDKFLNLYKKIKSNRMKMYENSRVFKPRGAQESSVKKLNSLRNDFIHFIPKGWSIEISGLPQIVDDCLHIISFLAFECGNINWYEQVLETKTRALLDEAKENVRLVRKAYRG